MISLFYVTEASDGQLRGLMCKVVAAAAVAVPRTCTKRKRSARGTHGRDMNNPGLGGLGGWGGECEGSKDGKPMEALLKASRVISFFYVTEASDGQLGGRCVKWWQQQRLLFRGRVLGVKVCEGRTR